MKEGYAITKLFYVWVIKSDEKILANYIEGLKWPTLLEAVRELKVEKRVKLKKVK